MFSALVSVQHVGEGLEKTNIKRPGSMDIHCAQFQAMPSAHLQDNFQYHRKHHDEAKLEVMALSFWKTIQNSKPITISTPEVADCLPQKMTHSILLR